MYDEFGFQEDFWEEPSDEAQSVTEEPIIPHVPIRTQFPESGSDYLGGSSDGWEYRSLFGGTRLAFTYDMIRQFLQDEGYGDVPIPATVEELRLFRRPKNPQLQMFSEQGYIHNPIKILFPTNKKVRNALALCIYNEQSPNHLLRFHGVLKD